MSTASERARLPSIRDVARLAGVSHQTVSRVLNDHPSIRPETKAKVVDAISVLDYRPNLAARALYQAAGWQEDDTQWYSVPLN